MDLEALELPGVGRIGFMALPSYTQCYPNEDFALAFHIIGTHGCTLTVGTQ